MTQDKRMILHAKVKLICGARVDLDCANASADQHLDDQVSRPDPACAKVDGMRARHERDPEIAAILVADVVGYSRLAGADEEGTLARLRALRSDLIDPTIAARHGLVVKRTGDGSLIEFRSVVDAVRCAIEVQNGMVERNAGVPEDRRIEFRIGVHLGDVVEEADGDLMGDGVNIAARLEGKAEPGAIALNPLTISRARANWTSMSDDPTSGPVGALSRACARPAPSMTAARRLAAILPPTSSQPAHGRGRGGDCAGGARAREARPMSPTTAAGSLRRRAMGFC